MNKNTNKKKNAPAVKPLRDLRPPSQPKTKWEPLPTFPHHQFSPPYSRLLTLGLTETYEAHEQIANSLKPEGKAAAQKLVEIALDASYEDYFVEALGYDWAKETRLMTPLNAVLTLARLGKGAAAGVEPLIPLLGTEDDELREALPEFYAAVGEAALPALLHTLNNDAEDEFVREGAADALSEIGQKHPALRERAISELEAALLRETENSAIGGYIVGYLLDLNAKESYPLIQEAFEKGIVDRRFISLSEVEEHFGLEISSPGEGCKGLEEIEAISDVLRQKADPGFEKKTTAQVSEPGTPFVKVLDVGRNDPCPCGSGKKYKKCHGA